MKKNLPTRSKNNCPCHVRDDEHKTNDDNHNNNISRRRTLIGNGIVLGFVLLIVGMALGFAWRPIVVEEDDITTAPTTTNIFIISKFSNVCKIIIHPSPNDTMKLVLFIAAFTSIASTGFAESLFHPCYWCRCCCNDWRCP
jgi:hypothetical protein